MSKKLDYDNLSDEDKDWLRARGWGNRIPGEAPDASAPGVELSSTASAEEVLAKTPNTGTATRPATEVVVEYTKEDYESWSVADLEDEVKDRNKTREDDAQIVPEGSGKDGNVVKADLVAALVADDQAGGGAPAEGDSES